MIFLSNMASYTSPDGNLHMCGLPEPEVLEMDTVLYYGFGGYEVRKDGEMYYRGESDEDWENFKTLEEIEKDAQKSPKSKWEVELYEPLSGATWQRNQLKGTGS
jgi:hypothetical protein